MEVRETIDALLREVRRRLAQAGTADAALEARLIVEHSTGISREHAVRAPQQPMDADVVVAVAAAVERRLAGEPVHRILGHRAFYGLDLALSADTLEPRPDTETLVEAMLPFIRDIAGRKGKCRILDLGTGTGAVALALLSEVPEAVAVAADLAPGGLETARMNAERTGLGTRFRTVRSDWFSAIDGRYDAIVSNPPYIRTAEIETLPREVRDFDPRLALDGGPDGLEAYRAIAASTASHLEPEGVIGVEIGAGQDADVEHAFARFELIGAYRDLAGFVRALLFKSGVPPK